MGWWVGVISQRKLCCEVCVSVECLEDDDDGRNRTEEMRRDMLYKVSIYL